MKAAFPLRNRPTPLSGAAVLRLLGALLRAFQLALPRLGVAWMFTLLTVNLNRVAIVELGIAAVTITAMLSVYNFLSPFQVVIGRWCDRYPIVGLRRTPYFLLSSLVASLVFLAFPSMLIMISQGSSLAIGLGFVLLTIFGLAFAASGDTYMSLIAEATTPRSRGGTIALAWTFLIAGTIITSIVLRGMMPDYTAEAMQRIYNLTPLVVMTASVVGVLGVERRLRGAALTTMQQRARLLAPQHNPFSDALRVLRLNRPARTFFVFMFLAILGIFLQDNILEVFGATVFGMNVGQTTAFQQQWGGGVLAGMLGIGLLSAIVPLNRKPLALVGAAGITLSLLVLAGTALSANQSLLAPTLVVMGLCTGLFNVGALSMMMDMTVDGATGMYMGLWGTSQALATATAALLSGLLYTLLVERGLLSFGLGFGVIFGLEAMIMLAGVFMLHRVHVTEFHAITQHDLTRAMANDQ